MALSSLHLTTGSVDKAATYAQSALDVRPGNALALSMMVRVLVAQGNTAKARETLVPLVKAFPKAPHVLNVMAAVQLAEHNVEAARASYNAARRHFTERYRGNDKDSCSSISRRVAPRMP